MAKPLEYGVVEHYNGKKRVPEKMRLSDSFMLKGENADLELTVTVVKQDLKN